MARVSVCDVNGATSPSCTVTRAIQTVHDQLESVCMRPAVENLLRPVGFKTISQPQILDAWHQGHNTGRVIVTQDFLANFDCLFDRLPVRISTSDLHHWTQRKKNYLVRAYDFGMQFSFNFITFFYGKDGDFILKSVTFAVVLAWEQHMYNCERYVQNLANVWYFCFLKEWEINASFESVVKPARTKIIVDDILGKSATTKIWWLRGEFCDISIRHDPNSLVQSKTSSCEHLKTAETQFYHFKSRIQMYAVRS